MCPGLGTGGTFLFSVEHPVFTAEGSQQWITDQGGNKYWPVDRYSEQGRRDTVFLGMQVVKYHRKLETYLNTLPGSGFTIERVAEPPPDPRLMERMGLQDELRRPMFLIVKARKL